VDSQSRIKDYQKHSCQLIFVCTDKKQSRDEITQLLVSFRESEVTCKLQRFGATKTRYKAVTSGVFCMLKHPTPEMK